MNSQWPWTVGFQFIKVFSWKILAVKGLNPRGGSLKIYTYVKSHVHFFLPIGKLLKCLLRLIHQTSNIILLLRQLNLLTHTPLDS